MHPSEWRMRAACNLRSQHNEFSSLTTVFHTQYYISQTDSETSIELNFAVLKFKHTVKKKKS